MHFRAPAERLQAVSQRSRIVEHLHDIELAPVIEPTSDDAGSIQLPMIFRRRFLLEQTIDKEHATVWSQQRSERAPQRLKSGDGDMREPERKEDQIEGLFRRPGEDVGGDVAHVRRAEARFRIAI